MSTLDQQVKVFNNKQIPLEFNTLTGTKAEFSTAVTDGEFFFSGDPYANGQVTEAATTRTLVITDAGKLIKCTNGAAVNVTIPPHADVAFVTGISVDVAQMGAGQVTLVAGSGVTLFTALTLLTRAQYSRVTVMKIDTNEWLVSGDLA